MKGVMIGIPGGDDEEAEGESGGMGGMDGDPVMLAARGLCKALGAPPERAGQVATAVEELVRSIVDREENGGESAMMPEPEGR